MIISLSGRKSSGKTFLAKKCEEKGYTLINFGDALKKLICEMLNIDLHTLNKDKEKMFEKQIYLKDYVDIIKSNIEIKDDDLYLLDKYLMSIRELLQYLGTNIIRKIQPDWHIQKTKEFIIKNNLLHSNLVFGDTRFKNEKAFLQSDFFNGNTVHCWYILSPLNFKSISNHISEIDLLWKDFNNRDCEYILVNDYTCDINDKWEKYINEKNPILCRTNEDYSYIPDTNNTSKIQNVLKKEFIIDITETEIKIAFRKNSPDIKYILKNIICKSSKEDDNYFFFNNAFLIENIKTYY